MMPIRLAFLAHAAFISAHGKRLHGVNITASHKIQNVVVKLDQSYDKNDGKVQILIVEDGKEDHPVATHNGVWLNIFQSMLMSLARLYQGEPIDVYINFDNPDENPNGLPRIQDADIGNVVEFLKKHSHSKSFMVKELNIRRHEIHNGKFLAQLTRLLGAETLGACYNPLLDVGLLWFANEECRAPSRLKTVYAFGVNRLPAKPLRIAPPTQENFAMAAGKLIFSCNKEKVGIGKNKFADGFLQALASSSAVQSADSSVQMLWLLALPNDDAVFTDQSKSDLLTILGRMPACTSVNLMFHNLHLTPDELASGTQGAFKGEVVLSADEKVKAA